MLLLIINITKHHLKNSFIQVLNNPAVKPIFEETQAHSEWLIPFQQPLHTPILTQQFL